MGHLLLAWAACVAIDLPPGMTITAELRPPQAAPGEEATLALRVVPPRGGTVLGFAQPDAAVFPARLFLDIDSAWSPLGELSEPVPKRRRDPLLGDGELRYHEGPVELRQRVRVRPAAALGKAQVAGSVTLVVATAGKLMVVRKHPFAAPLHIAQPPKPLPPPLPPAEPIAQVAPPNAAAADAFAGLALPPPPALAATVVEARPSAAPTFALPDFGLDPADTWSAWTSKKATRSEWLALGMGILAGLATLAAGPRGERYRTLGARLSSWTRGELIAAGALGVAVGVGVTEARQHIWPLAAACGAAWATFAAGDRRVGSPRSLRGWLADHVRRTSFALPAALAVNGLHGPPWLAGAACGAVLFLRALFVAEDEAFLERPAEPPTPAPRELPRTAPVVREDRRVARKPSLADAVAAQAATAAVAAAAAAAAVKAAAPPDEDDAEEEEDSTDEDAEDEDEASDEDDEAEEEEEDEDESEEEEEAAAPPPRRGKSRAA